MTKSASAETPVQYDQELLLDLYKKMLLIRLFEERAAHEFKAGKIPGVVHLYAGEEACAVGVCAHLRLTDAVTSTHRGHGHCLAKGADLKRMVAELMGRSSGVCRGKGGSMHIAEVDKGILGANGIVGAGLPLACGAALAAQYRGSDDVAVSFFGDGAANIGYFNEALNLAAIWKLPVLFVAENNGYAEATPFEYHCAVASVADRASAYSMPGTSVDGGDVLAVYEAAGEAITRARGGDGPSLLEVRTARLAGHYEGDTQTYRSDGEGAALVDRDPLVRLREQLAMVPVEVFELAAIEEAITERLNDAWSFAEASPLPAPEEALDGAYASYGAPR
jgi:TPP-dependent pyruvate/acetoin dehydrogenase alpha subunit